MKRILSEGRIDEWCKDNLDYFRKGFGEKNIVSAVLHLDEKTPHIHIALVPVVLTSTMRHPKIFSKNSYRTRVQLICAFL
jgi:hypothetical protein